jgi:protocatechuate 3,4-dioxygenase beta subunit
VTDAELTRRKLLELGLALPPVAALSAGADGLLDAALAGGAELTATPACGDPDDETPDQTEGPFYTPRTPRRRSLVTAGVPGTRLTLTGRVLTTRCRPVPRALLDFWQADAGGRYDNTGFRLRGHQFTDARGRYRLETIVPGLYTGRTRHIHVKVRAPGSPVLTTQLYFPGEAQNKTDGIFDPALVVRRWRRVNSRRVAQFDFVLAVA